MREPFFNRVTIIGVGLIGASCALALKGLGLCGTVCGYGRKEANLRQAKERGIIDEYSLDIAKACEHADLVILSTPVGLFKKLLNEMQSALKTNAIVTDVGSVKGSLVPEMEALMPEGAYYVGSHPIAGSDRSGIAHARADLFEGARCIVTPTARSEDKAVRKIISLWEAFGGNVELMDPMLHDDIYAAVSHLPHLIAYALVNTIDDSNAEYLRYAGPGFKDTTRIALSSPELWRDIALLNGDNLIALIKRLGSNLDMIASLIKNADAEGLEQEFSKARALRQKIQ
jgi:prephenate dehydrogenase